MNTIMVDNWVVQEVIYNSFNTQMSEEYAKYLSAIVLWDKIYYADNEYSHAWNYLPSTIRSVLNPIQDRDNLFEDEARKLYCDRYSLYPEIVAKRAIRYMLFSNYCGCNYFPCAKRAHFLKENNPYGIVNEISRFDYIKTLDEEINEYFYKMFEKLGRYDFRIKRPVLVDFIIQNTKDAESYIDSALRIKEEKSVVQYRKYLSDIEAAVERKEWNLLKDMIAYSEDIVKNTVCLDCKNIGTIDVTIAPVPSISYSKNIELKRRKMHLNFLEELGNFAFHGRNIE